MLDALATENNFMRLLRRSGRVKAVLWLLALALLIRGLMPAGFMPNIAKDAAFPITICSAQGAKTILVAAADYLTKKTKDTPSDTSLQKQHDCVLCAAPVQAAGSDGLLHPDAVLFFVAILTFITWLGVCRARYEAAAAPRGPPFIS